MATTTATLTASSPATLLNRHHYYTESKTDASVVSSQDKPLDISPPSELERGVDPKPKPKPEHNIDEPLSQSAQPSPSPAAQAIYTPILLAIYDFWVLGIINTFAWGCSTARYLVPLFRANVFSNHLDLGVGTGYYLAACVPESTRLTLIDAEQGALDVAMARAARHDADAVIADVLAPLPLPRSARFDSVSMYFLLHCLPAAVQEKCGVFAHVKRNMTADGVLHGASVLGKGVRQDGVLAAFFRRLFVRHGVFHNKNDNAFDFEEALRRNFKRVETRVVGSVFIFRAQGPKDE